MERGQARSGLVRRLLGARKVGPVGHQAARPAPGVRSRHLRPGLHQRDHPPGSDLLDGQPVLRRGRQHLRSMGVLLLCRT